MRSRGPLLLGMLLLVVVAGGSVALMTGKAQPDEELPDPQIQVLAEEIAPVPDLVPSDDRARGVVFDGLRPGSQDGPCEGLFELDVPGLPPMCTYGPDPAPDGIDVTVFPTLALLDEETTGEEFTLPLIDDGVSGDRVQAIYVVAADRPGRYHEVAPLIERWAVELDRMYAGSGADGERHIRFVTNPDGRPNVAMAVLSRTGDDSIGNTIKDLRALGYDDPSRKYLVWMDAAVYCGIAQIHPADRPAPDDWEGLSMYARVDAACWGHPFGVEARQLALTLGAERPPSNAPGESLNWDIPDSSFLHSGEPGDPESPSSSTNKPPGVNAGRDLTVILPDPASLKGRVSDDGLPDGTLAITWSNVSGPGTVTFGDASVVETEASFSAAGTYVLRLVADDGELVAGDTITVTVANPGDPPPPPPPPLANTAPVVEAGPARTVTLPDQASLDGTVSDDGLPTGTLVTTWSMVSGPGTVTFGDASAVDTSATFSAAGSYVLRLAADDGELVSSDTITVTVLNPGDPPPPPPPPGNTAPVVDAGLDLTVTLPDQASLDGTVSDDGQPGGTLVTAWSKVSGPGTVTFGDASTVDTTASFSAAGTYVLELTADDGELVSADTITVTVGDPPPGPTEVTEVFDSNLNQQNPTRSFLVAMAAGPATAVLTVEARGGPAPELTLEVFDSAGNLFDSATGPSPVVIAGDMAAGTWTYVVSGSDKAWFTLEVTHYQ